MIVVGISLMLWAGWRTTCGSRRSDDAEGCQENRIDLIPAGGRLAMAVRRGATSRVEDAEDAG